MCRRALLAILLALFLRSEPLSAALSFERHLSSITYLVENEGVQCTTWSINERQGLWITAAHCAVIETEDGDIYARTLFLRTKPVTVVRFDLSSDLALLKADVHRPGLRLGWLPAAGDAATVYGYPLGIPAPVALFVHVANPWYPYEGWPQAMLFSGHGWPGHSGSPIFDRRGRVISVCQATVVHGSRGDVGGMLGVAWAPLKAFGVDLWES